MPASCFSGLHTVWWLTSFPTGQQFCISAAGIAPLEFRLDSIHLAHVVFWLSENELTTEGTQVQRGPQGEPLTGACVIPEPWASTINGCMPLGRSATAES